MSSATFPISDVAEFLVRDGFLHTKRTAFAELLGVKSATIQQFNNLLTMGIHTPAEYYTNLLQEWVGPLGKDATVTKFRDILVTGNFKSAADSLLKSLESNKKDAVVSIRSSVAAVRSKEECCLELRNFSERERPLPKEIDPLLKSDKTENDDGNNNAMEEQKQSKAGCTRDDDVEKATVDADSKQHFCRKNKTCLLASGAAAGITILGLIIFVVVFALVKREDGNDKLSSSKPPLNEDPVFVTVTSLPASSSNTSAVASPTDNVADNSSSTRNNGLNAFKITNTLESIKCNSTTALGIQLILQDVGGFNFKDEKYKKCLPLIVILEIDGGGHMKIELFAELLSYLENVHTIIFRNLDEYCSKSRPSSVFNAQRNEYSAVDSIEFRDFGTGCEDGLKKLGQIPTLQSAWKVHYHNCSFTESNVNKFAEFIIMSIYPVDVKCVGEKCASLKKYLSDKITFCGVNEHDNFVSFTKGLLSETKK